MSKDRGTRRLRVALLAYPRDTRQAEGEVLTSLARDMVEDGQSSVNRESFGLLRGGLVARAGDLADAPWEQALHRVSLPIAAALMALILGEFAFWQGFEGLAWPGWSWILALAAPALAIIGLLSGRRIPLALGGSLICLLGVAQGNGLFLATRLQDGTFSWATGGLSLLLLACSIPAGLLLLATSLCAGHRASRATILTTLTWVVVGAITVRLLFNYYETVGTVTVNGIGIFMVAYGIAVIVWVMVGIWRRRRDPAGMLAGTLGFATILPIMLLYGVSLVPLGDRPPLVLLALSALAGTAVLVWAVRLTPRTGR